jgi:hypothetical protein
MIERLISVSFQQVDAWLPGRRGTDQAVIQNAGHDDADVPRTRRAARFSDKRCERHPEQRDEQANDREATDEHGVPLDFDLEDTRAALNAP